jgi:hypothetical protein
VYPEDGPGETLEIRKLPPASARREALRNLRREIADELGETAD